MIRSQAAVCVRLGPFRSRLGQIPKLEHEDLARTEGCTELQTERVSRNATEQILSFRCVDCFVGDEESILHATDCTV